MTSQHWICALILAMICCLTAQPVKRDVEAELQRSLEEFKTAVDEAGCLKEEHKYHTPTSTNKNLLGSALNCSVEQLKVLHDDCENATEDLYDDLDTELKETLKTMLDSSFSDPSFSCENSPQKNFKDFLENIKEILQHINAQKK